MCDRISNTVHLLDQDGGFLSIIRSSQQSIKCPRGVCVDDKNNLYVGQRDTNTVTVNKCISNTVHLLDQDGGFLSIIRSSQQSIKCPRGVCVDDKNNLYVGQRDTNTVTVNKYLQ